MCGLCGVLGSEDDWTNAPAMPALGTRRAERLNRVRVVNLVLSAFALELTDWQGAKYQLKSRTGRTEIVDNLSQVWQAAERIVGRACDPLDPAVVARIEQKG